VLTQEGREKDSYALIDSNALLVILLQLQYNECL